MNNDDYEGDDDEWKIIMVHNKCLGHIEKYASLYKQ